MGFHPLQGFKVIWGLLSGEVYSETMRDSFATGDESSYYIRLACDDLTLAHINQCIAPPYR